MNFRTPIELPPKAITLDTDSKVMLIGSCFAENVGEKLQIQMGKENVDVNPFGVLYNPISIAQALRILIKGKYPQTLDSKHTTDSKLYTLNSTLFKGQDGLWHSWLHTSHFSSTTEEGCYRAIKERLEQSHEALKHTDVLIITFGTTRCYYLKGTNTPVANCHKEPQRCFDEVEPTLKELKKDWQSLINEIYEFNKKLKIIFTVSPYRYRKYGFHESQIQKAKLLLLIENLMTLNSRLPADSTLYNLHSTLNYFPSYEIMMDELRDYRFYDTDMLHPSNQAVDYILERFIEWTFTDDLKQKGQDNIKISKQQSHRQITH